MLNETFFSATEDYKFAVAGVFRDLDTAKPVLVHLPGHQVIADVGCGPGQSFQYLAHADQVFAIDCNSDMLARAQQTADAEGYDNIVFLHDDMENYTLPKPADLTLLSNSFFPEGLRHADEILSNIQKQTALGGKVVMVLPAMEALLYYFHLSYRSGLSNGSSEEKALGEMRDFYANIMTYGYYYNPTGTAHGQLIKHWTKEELNDLLTTARFSSITIEKFTLPWDVYYPDATPLHSHEPTWFWLAVMENRESG